MRPPYQFVGDDLSTDTIEVLQSLLNQAKEGQIIGLSFAAMYKRRQYIVNSAGEAHRNPTFAAGMVQVLLSQLTEQIRGP